LPKTALTVLAGKFADIKSPIIKNFLIQTFIKKYQVNMQEALEEDPTAYQTFNDFFIRTLKPEARPIADADIISPVDGCVSELGAIGAGKIIQAKGLDYTVTELLGGKEDVAAPFMQGQFATLYLSPKDYHRVHMPLNADLLSMSYVPGALFSVRPSTAASIPRLFARNERLVIFFDTVIGPMAMILVGATIVGAIGTSWHGDVLRSREQTQFLYQADSMSTARKKGEEAGYFKLGSTVILLFAEGNKMQWRQDLNAGSSIRFGEALGHFVRG